MIWDPSMGTWGDTYEVDGYCTNCDYRGPIKIQKGQHIPLESTFGGLFGGQIGRGLPVRCPTCGCMSCYGKRK